MILLLLLLHLPSSLASIMNWWPYQTVVIASRDNTLYWSDDPHDQLSNGAGGSFIVGRTGQQIPCPPADPYCTVRRGVIFFNLSRVLDPVMSLGEDDKPIKSVALEMTVRKTGPNDAEIEMYALTQNFGEGSSDASGAPGQGAEAQPGDATWLFSFYPNTSWTTPGGDYADVSIAVQNVSRQITYQWASPLLSKQLVNLYRQSERNFGWLLKVKDESERGTAKEFYGHQCSAGALRPKIIVTYVGPPPVWFWYVTGLGGLIGFIVVAALVWMKVSSSRRSSYQYNTIRDFSRMTSISSLEELFNDPGIRIIDMGEVKLGRVIGTGAFGAVFEGTLSNGTRLAIKKVNVQVGEEADLMAFAEEVKIMSAIAHPNLLALHAIAFSEDLTDVVLMTELIENGSLSDNLFKKQRKFKPSKKVKILREIAFGMHYLHSVRPRIIHRDLKSDNILMTRTYSAKIADFGMSKMIQEQSKVMTRSGTPHYMAPESIQEGKFSEKSDVYSYGVVCWELYKESRPYPTIHSPYQIMYKVIHENLKPEIPVDCPPIYTYLIANCTAREASQRPPFKEILLKFDILQTAPLPDIIIQ